MVPAIKTAANPTIRYRTVRRFPLGGVDDSAVSGGKADVLLPAFDCLVFFLRLTCCLLYRLWRSTAVYRIDIKWWLHAPKIKNRDANYNLLGENLI